LRIREHVTAGLQQLPSIRLHFSSNYPNFGRLGVLIPQDAWCPATLAAPAGTWDGLKDTGIQV
jgi:hypothetical protein